MKDFFCIFLSGEPELFLHKSLVMEELHFDMKCLTNTIYKQMTGLCEPNSCFSAVKTSSNRLAIFHNQNRNIKHMKSKLAADSGARSY